MAASCFVSDLEIVKSVRENFHILMDISYLTFDILSDIRYLSVHGVLHEFKTIMQTVKVF